MAMGSSVLVARLNAADGLLPRKHTQIFLQQQRPDKPGGFQREFVFIFIKGADQVGKLSVLRRQEVEHVKRRFPGGRSTGSISAASPRAAVMQREGSAPRVDLRPRAAAGVERRLLLQRVAAVEAEAVAFAVGRALQLLQEEDDGVVDHAQDARAAHHAQRELLQVEGRSRLEDAVDHGAPRH